MNLLIDELPEAVEVGGSEYQINTDFRVAIRVLLAFESNELTTVEKRMAMLGNLYPVMPEDTAEAARLAIQFLNGGKQTVEDGEAGPRVYSFGKDAELIFAAFKQTHDVDLEATEYLHWWKFLAMFMDLGAETAFCNLVSLRRRVKTGKASKEDREMAREIGEAFEVPETDMRSLEEKEQEAAFFAALHLANGS